MQYLKPCPFCGHEPDITDGDSLYPNGMGWKDEGEYRSYHKGMEVPKEQWCYTAGCSELSGGCSAEVFGDTRQEAIDKWNARAIPATHRIVPVELLERCTEQLLEGAEAHQSLNDEFGNSSRIAPGRIACETLSDELRAIIDKEPTCPSA